MIYPVDSAIQRLNNWSLVDKSFKDNWFNETHDLNLDRTQLVELLELATTKQLDGNLYEQFDGVAMGSAL